MKRKSLLTKKEQQIHALLGKAFNLFTELEAYHPSDSPEFANAIHVCQNIVLSRPAFVSQAFVDLAVYNARMKEIEEESK